MRIRTNCRTRHSNGRPWYQHLELLSGLHPFFSAIVHSARRTWLLISIVFCPKPLIMMNTWLRPSARQYAHTSLTQVHPRRYL